MPEWFDRNPSLGSAVALIGLVLATLFLVLWLVSRRNTRLLSRELDDADRELASRERAAAEQGARLKIVRELHDVAVRSVSTIIETSDAARYVVHTDPAIANRTAVKVGMIARAALTDLRRIVTVAAEGEQHSHSSPSIAEVGELIAAQQSTGLSVVFVETGGRFALQRGAEVAIYRIVEESLANALRYGGSGTEVTVSFAWTRNGLQVLVDDDGAQAEARRRGTSSAGTVGAYTFEDDLAALTRVVSGAGVTEMRERTTAFGGVFNAYPVPGVGFSVSAIFPALRHDNAVHTVDLGR